MSGMRKISKLLGPIPNQKVTGKNGQQLPFYHLPQVFYNKIQFQ